MTSERELGAVPERTSIDAVTELRAQAEEIAEARLTGFRDAIESGSMSRDELLALQKGLETLRANANSPEELMAYCQRYILGIDAEALAEHGVDITATPMVETGHARKTKEIRKLLDRILQDHDLFLELRANADLRESGDLTDDQLQIYAEADDQYRRSLDSLDLGDDLRESFLVRAAEERRQSEMEVRGLQTPEERLQQDMLQLVEHLKEMVTETILSANISNEHGRIDAGIIKLIAESPFAKLIHSREFRMMADMIEESAKQVLQDTVEWLNTADGQWDADPKVRRRAQCVMALKKTAAAIAALTGMVAAGPGMVVLGTSSAVGAFVAGSWAVGALGIMGMPAIKQLGDRMCGNITEGLDQYSDALAEVTGVRTKRQISADQVGLLEDHGELGDDSLITATAGERPIFDSRLREQERLRRARAAQASAAARNGQPMPRNL